MFVTHTIHSRVFLNTETWQVQTDLEQKEDKIVDIDFIFTRLSQMLFKDDLINLPRYSMYLKLMIDGTTSKPFSAYTIPLKECNRSYKERIVSISQNTFGKKKVEVEKSINSKYLKLNKEIRQTTLFSED